MEQDKQEKDAITEQNKGKMEKKKIENWNGK